MSGLDISRARMSGAQMLGAERMISNLRRASPLDAVDVTSAVDSAVQTFVAVQICKEMPAAELRFGEPLCTAIANVATADRYRPELAHVAAEICLHFLEQAMAARLLEPFIEKLSERLCSPQTFDPQDVHCAYQLIRSFAESTITFEVDVPAAMTQVAAIAAGVVWTPLEYDTILKMCWATVVRHVASSPFREGNELMFQMSMRRIAPEHWTAGLGYLPQLQEKVVASRQVNQAGLCSGDSSFRVRVCLPKPQQVSAATTDVSVVIGWELGGPDGTPTSLFIAQCNLTREEHAYPSDITLRLHDEMAWPGRNLDICRLCAAVLVVVLGLVVMHLYLGT
eukprot:SAG11_NODE_1828_length_4196_cov_3.555528_1_plen_338_part_00